MRLFPRIVFFVILTCLVPLLVLAWSGRTVTREGYAEVVAAAQAESATTLAEVIAREVSLAQRTLTLQLENFRLAAAPPQALQTFLLATWRLSPDFSIALLRGADGEELVPPVYQSADGPPLGTQHDVVPRSRLDAFRERSAVPGVGAPYIPPGAGDAVIPLVLASPWGDGLTLAVELRLGAWLVQTGRREVVLVADTGAILARWGEDRWVEPAQFQSILGTELASVRYTTAEDREVLASLAAVSGLPMSVVVAESAETSAAKAQDIQRRTTYIAFVAVVVALVMGFLLTRSVTDPVWQLQRATQAIARGELFRRVATEGSDELADLGRAFNDMARSLEQNQRTIAAKNEEIEGWNRDLQRRVEQRTAQLQEAQSRLVQAGQRAAVGELSAGLAHELNNPLAGILGLVQLVMARLPGGAEATLLRTAEQEALRCKEIVANLLRLTAEPAGPAERARVDLHAVVDEVLGLMASQLRARGVDLARERGVEPAATDVDPTAVARAFGQVLTSLRGLAAQGSRLRVRTEAAAEGPRVIFSLGAASESQDDWRAAALGFWVARQVLEQNGATLEEPADASEPSWTLRFRPVADAA